MKPFFSSAQNLIADTRTPETLASGSFDRALPADPFVGRLAIYDTAAAAPRVEDVQAGNAREFIDRLASQVYSVARDKGGDIPYTVIREVVENLIHANFSDPVISVLNEGSVIRFSDQGPGIPDKDRALLPGYTTATSPMKHLIRGVGSGFPLVGEFLSHQGGSLSIEDNLDRGTVVTLSIDCPPLDTSTSSANDTVAAPVDEQISSIPRLSTRQKQVLSLVMEFSEAGPTLVSKELSVALSTAYRDLAFLENSGLISSGETGKRTVTDLGTLYLDSLFR